MNTLWVIAGFWLGQPFFPAAYPFVKDDVISKPANFFLHAFIIGKVQHKNRCYRIIPAGGCTYLGNFIDD